MNVLIDWMERDLLPDILIRVGIRHLNKKTLLRECRGDVTERLERKGKLFEFLKTEPIAVATNTANRQHYELPPEFFQYVMGTHMKYSCCIWGRDVNSLQDAEARALSITAQRAGIADGMKILDLGCGWGSLSLWIAEHFRSCQVTSVSNSSLQRAFIEKRCRDKNITNIRVITADMNEFDTEERFDRIVSVEMFEHMRNYQQLLKKTASWLQPDGRLFVHIFCHREYSYLFKTEGDENWMGQYFFTGGIMPSDDLFFHFQDDMIVEQHWRICGTHYQKTCEAWLANMDKNRRSILDIFKAIYRPNEASLWFQRWRVFFMACAELFGHSGGNEWFVGHYLFQQR